MEKKNSVVMDIAIGVAVGAAVTMLRKENREKLAGNVRKARTKMTEIREHAAPIKDRVKESVQTVSVKGREMTDLQNVKGKVEEIRKLTPVVVETLKETRDIFNKKKQELKDASAVEVQEEKLEQEHQETLSAAVEAEGEQPVEVVVAATEETVEEAAVPESITEKEAIIK